MKSLAIAYVMRHNDEVSICHNRDDDLHRRWNMTNNLLYDLIKIPYLTQSFTWESNGKYIAHNNMINQNLSPLFN